MYLLVSTASCGYNVCMNLGERFWGRMVGLPSGCLEWTGGTTPDGYGKIKIDGVTVVAHRLAWTLTVGPIPEGMCVCHTCDNPPCCNVNHLWLGTNAENMADKMAKGRYGPGGWGGYQSAKTRCPQNHPYDDANTYIQPSTGGRACRACNRAAGARWRARQVTLM